MSIECIRGILVGQGLSCIFRASAAAAGGRSARAFGRIYSTHTTATSRPRESVIRALSRGQFCTLSLHSREKDCKRRAFGESARECAHSTEDKTKLLLCKCNSRRVSSHSERGHNKRAHRIGDLSPTCCTLLRCSLVSCWWARPARKPFLFRFVY